MRGLSYDKVHQIVKSSLTAFYTDAHALPSDEAREFEAHKLASVFVDILTARQELKEGKTNA
jgi:hypothetical protein